MGEQERASLALSRWSAETGGYWQDRGCGFHVGGRWGRFLSAGEVLRQFAAWSGEVV